ncbi:hypothetical+protein [Methylocapsa aurea]|uniref:hypothetical protein n=1 Tax=Methylocapsa aurea TaxID=663610 RepID=UPI003D18C992
MFQIISAAIAALSLVAAYAAAWRIYRTAWSRKPTTEREGAGALLLRALLLRLRRRRMKMRYAGARLSSRSLAKA